MLASTLAFERHELGESARRTFARRQTPIPDRVLELVADSACSAYNCEYIALARELAVPVVTADRQLLREFPEYAISPKDFVAASAT